MTTALNRTAYHQLVDEDVAWLEKQPRTLERDHVIQIVKDSVRCYYGEATASVGVDAPQCPVSYESGGPIPGMKARVQICCQKGEGHDGPHVDGDGGWPVTHTLCNISCQNDQMVCGKHHVAMRKRIEELDAQLSLVLADAHQRGHYGPVHATAELVLLLLEPRDSVSEELSSSSAPKPVPIPESIRPCPSEAPKPSHHPMCASFDFDPDEQLGSEEPCDCLVSQGSRTKEAQPPKASCGWCKGNPIGHCAICQAKPSSPETYADDAPQRPNEAKPDEVCGEPILLGCMRDPGHDGEHYVDASWSEDMKVHLRPDSAKAQDSETPVFRQWLESFISAQCDAGTDLSFIRGLEAVREALDSGEWRLVTMPRPEPAQTSEGVRTTRGESASAVPSLSLADRGSDESASFGTPWRDVVHVLLETIKRDVTWPVDGLHKAMVEAAVSVGEKALDGSLTARTETALVPSPEWLRKHAHQPDDILTALLSFHDGDCVHLWRENGACDLCGSSPTGSEER